MGVPAGARTAFESCVLTLAARTTCGATWRPSASPGRYVEEGIITGEIASNSRQTANTRARRLFRIDIAAMSPAIQDQRHRAKPSSRTIARICEHF